MHEISQPQPPPEPADGTHSAAPVRVVEPGFSTRLTWLFVILGFLTLLIVLPPFVKKTQYAWEYGKQRAQVDVALAALDEMKIEGLATASRLVARGVGPSVVHIRTSSANGRIFSDSVRLNSREEGSGVIVDAGGYVLTNNHVIQKANSISVQLSDGRSVPAHVVGTDVLTDLAVLKINAPDLIAAPWGDSDELQTGDMVWALGSPFGLDHSVTFGIVSATRRQHVTSNPHQNFVQTDAAVNPGNSGGPLVNIRGEVVGINTAIVGRAYQGISFAIPSTHARGVYDQLKEQGEVARGWLGVQLAEVDVTPETGGTPETGAGARDTQRQVHVGSVLEDSPAQRAGMNEGDLILKWNDQPVPDAATLVLLVASTEVGSTAVVHLERDGKQRTIKVHVGQRPSRY